MDFTLNGGPMDGAVVAIYMDPSKAPEGWKILYAVNIGTNTMGGYICPNEEDFLQQQLYFCPDLSLTDNHKTHRPFDKQEHAKASKVYGKDIADWMYSSSNLDWRDHQEAKKTRVVPPTPQEEHLRSTLEVKKEKIRKEMRLY